MQTRSFGKEFQSSMHLSIYLLSISTASPPLGDYVQEMHSAVKILNTLAYLVLMSDHVLYSHSM